MAGLKPNPLSVFPVPNQLALGASIDHTGAISSRLARADNNSPTESPVAEFTRIGETPP